MRKRLVYLLAAILLVAVVGVGADMDEAPPDRRG